jgi:hypothetical protein
MGLKPELLLEEILLAQQAGAQGVCFFRFYSLEARHLLALKTGPFRLPASLPLFREKDGTETFSESR